MTTRRLLPLASLLAMTWLQGCSGTVIFDASNDGGEGGAVSTRSTTSRAAAQAAQQNAAVTGSVNAATASAAQQASAQQTAAQQATVQQASAQVSAGTSMPSCDEGNCALCEQCAWQPGAACEPQYNTCIANADCPPFIDCFQHCPEDDPATPIDEKVVCACTTEDGINCAPVSEPGTCFGDYPNGYDDYVVLATCIAQICPSSCL